MGIFRRIAGFLGFVKDDGHEVKDEEDDDSASQPRNRPHFKETGLPRKGFSVPVQVAVDRSQPGPLLAPSDSGDGGVQVLIVSLAFFFPQLLIFFFFFGSRVSLM